jgi:hypothetical protein
MKYLMLFISVLCLSATIAQNKQVLYGLEEVPQSLLLNPGGRVSQKAHFGIPLLSQFHLNAGVTGVTVFDIFGATGENINEKIRRTVFSLENTDFFSATQQLEIINFGWRSKKNIYFSGGVYEEFDFIIYYPRDLAILAYEGNANHIGEPFDLGELQTTGDLLTVYHFGASKEISKKLTVGLRAKLYSSMFSFKSTDNRGTFITSEGNPDSENIYEHSILDLDASIQTSGYASLRDMDGSSEVVSEILGRALFGGNLGIGVDLGATYDITNRLTATASVLDLGAIFHSNDVESYRVSGDYTLDGIELIFPPLANGEATFPYYQNLEDEFEEQIPVDTLNSGYSQLRPLKVNAGLKYSFGKASENSGDCDCLNMGAGIQRNQAVGLQFYSIQRPKGTQMAGTLFYYRRLWNFLSAKATYTIDSYSKDNVGFGIVADIGKVNFYMAADNLLRYENLAKANSVSLQLGFNIKIDSE